MKLARTALLGLSLFCVAAAPQADGTCPPGDETCLAQLGTVVGDAATTLSRDNRYIYYRTPWADMTDEHKNAVWKESLAIMSVELGDRLPKVLHTRDAFEKFAEEFPTIDPLLAQLETFNQLDESGMVGKDLIPSAFICQGGGKIKGSWGGGAGAGAGMGTVLVPFHVKQIDPTTQTVIDEYLEFQTAFYSVVDAGAGVGAGGGPRGYAGCGVVWGRLTSPEQFRGFSFGPSATVAKLGGINLKLMGLNRSDSDKWVDNVYFLGSFIFGAVAEGSVHVVGKFVMDPDTFITGVMSGMEADMEPKTVRRPLPQTDNP